MASDNLVQSYDLYVDGSWLAAPGRMEDRSPATGEVFADAPDASVEQMASAVSAARRAFDDGPWARMSGEERAKCLTQLGNALMNRGDAWASLAATEWGCTENQRLLQVDTPAFMALRQAELAGLPLEEEVEAFGAGGRTLFMREPLGVVSVLTPWNFPHTLNTMKTVAALAVGNTVVVKPSPLTPLSGLALAKIIDEETDIPPGVVNVVPTSSLEASKLLVEDPRVDMVSFTGSTAIGREVMAGAASTMKRILLECGGKSASIFLEDVDLDSLLPQILFEGCTLHAGQACILYSRLLVPESMRAEVVSRLAALAPEVRLGDPADPATEMGPLISEAHRQRVEGHVTQAVADGAKVAAGGGRPSGLDRGYFFEPTILDNVDPGSHIAQEEVFGPVLCVIGYRDVDEAVRIANDTIYGLVGAVWGGDNDRALDVARQLRTGQVTVNGVGPGDAPFGGFKQSGIGREGGMAGREQYTELKAIGFPA